MNPLETPDSSGWWLWYEGGDTDDKPERLLISVHAGHASVCYDDELCDALDIDVDDVNEDSAFSFNYWAGTDCDQKNMPGVWVKDANQGPGEIPTQCLYEKGRRA